MHQRVTPFVRVTDLKVSFQGMDVVGPLSFAVRPGEVVGIAGPNGSGKTTLARVLVGFDAPSSGDVSVGECTPIRWRLIHGVGFLPEDLPRPWPCSVKEILALRPGVLRRIVDREQDVFRVSELLNRPIRVLSKGQWRSVLLSYACLSNSRLVVLDEPDTGLDPSALERFQQIVRVMSMNNVAVIVMSHQLAELGRACHRVGFLYKGRLQAEVECAQMSAAEMRGLYHHHIPGRDSMEGA